jgi:hypothetical protein
MVVFAILSAAVLGSPAAAGAAEAPFDVSFLPASSDFMGRFRGFGVAGFGRSASKRRSSPIEDVDILLFDDERSISDEDRPQSLLPARLQRQLERRTGKLLYNV